MDFKGITWVANVYQRFEAMCLEVEETMCQDTYKYVENQAQTVGASVKKFYSDVMQDFPLPSCIDPVKVAEADLSLYPYSHVRIYKKPKASIKDDPIKVDRQLTEDSKVITGVDADHISSFGEPRIHSFPTQSSRNSGEGACNELNLGKNELGGVCEHSNVGIKGKSENNNHAPSKTKKKFTSMSEDWSSASSCFEISESHESASDEMAMRSTQASIEVTGCDFQGGKISNFVVDANMSLLDHSTDSQKYDTIVLAEDSGKKGTESRHTSSCSGLSSESIAADPCTNSGLVSQIGSNISMNTEYSEPTGEGVFMPHTGRSGDTNADVVIENNYIIEPGMETIEQVDDSKLEEMCVLVDRDKLFVSQRDGKRKSYKKKIREAFSSKTRSARKQEYEQLVAQYGDIDTESNQVRAERVMPNVTTDLNTKKLPICDYCDSEWELL